MLPDGDPHMAALLSRPDFAARLDRLGGARLHADLPSGDDELIARIGDATVVILGAYLTGPVLRRLPKLRLVAFTGTGAATFVDLPAARLRHRGRERRPLRRRRRRRARPRPRPRAGQERRRQRPRRPGGGVARRRTSWPARRPGSSATAASAPGFAGLLEAIGLNVVVWTPHPDLRPGPDLENPAVNVELFQGDREKSLADVEVQTSSLHLTLTADTTGIIDECP